MCRRDSCYTREDLDRWSDQVARVAVGGGATAGDIIQISFGYGLFTGALGLHYGLEKIGAVVIPASSGNTAKQLMMLRDFGVTGLVATPSYALYLSETMKEQGYPRSCLLYTSTIPTSEDWWHMYAYVDGQPLTFRSEYDSSKQFAIRGKSFIHNVSVPSSKGIVEVVLEDYSGNLSEPAYIPYGYTCLLYTSRSNAEQNQGENHAVISPEIQHQQRCRR